MRMMFGGRKREELEAGHLVSDAEEDEPAWVARRRARAEADLAEARRIAATIPMATTERGIGWVITFRKNRKDREEDRDRRS